MRYSIRHLGLIMVAGVLRLLFASCRVRFSGVDNLRAAEAAGGGYLLGIWHEHAINGSAGYVNEGLGALVSSSHDGAYIAYLFRRMGVVPVRGSSTRGGKVARGEISRYLRAGLTIAITIDGPRGPHRICKPGIIDLARATGVPIVPGAALCSRFHQINSWDRQQFPLPFSKLLMHHGEPIFVPENTTGVSFEGYQREVERQILQTQVEGQRLFADWSGIAKGSPRPRMPRGWVNKMMARHATRE